MMIMWYLLTKSIFLVPIIFLVSDGEERVLFLAFL